MNFLDRFLENTQISNLMKTHPVGAKLFHTDRWVDEWTDTIKPIVICTILQTRLKMTPHPGYVTVMNHLLTQLLQEYERVLLT